MRSRSERPDDHPADQDGVALTAYAGEGGAMRAVLPHKRAALVGLDLLSLALEPLFRARVEDDPTLQTGPLQGRANPPAEAG